MPTRNRPTPRQCSEALHTLLAAAWFCVHVRTGQALAALRRRSYLFALQHHNH